LPSSCDESRSAGRSRPLRPQRPAFIVITRRAARRIDKDFEEHNKRGEVIKDEGAIVSIYTQIGGDDDKTHKKLHILDAEGPREITEMSRIVGELEEKTQFTHYYFENESDRDRRGCQRRSGVMEREDIVAAVVAAAGGTLTGRVRLQKAVYLLDRLGLNSGFGYEYHHYGPYSRDLDSATADAKAFELIEEEYEHRQSDGAMYSIFKLSPGTAVNKAVYGDLRQEQMSELAKLFAGTNVTVLELAATIDWLWREEKHADWRSEITKRKGVKVRSGRLERAVDLLRDLGLPPPMTAAA
jgi:uncharacterized protein